MDELQAETPCCEMWETRGGWADCSELTGSLIATQMITLFNRGEQKLKRNLRNAQNIKPWRGSATTAGDHISIHLGQPRTRIWGHHDEHMVSQPGPVKTPKRTGVIYLFIYVFLNFSCPDWVSWCPWLPQIPVLGWQEGNMTWSSGVLGHPHKGSNVGTSWDAFLLTAGVKSDHFPLRSPLVSTRRFHPQNCRSLGFMVFVCFPCTFLRKLYRPLDVKIPGDRTFLKYSIQPNWYLQPWCS